MKQIGLTITFTGEDGATRDDSYNVAPDYDADAAGEHRLAHILLAELKIMVGKQGPPKHKRHRARLARIPEHPHEHNSVLRYRECAGGVGVNLRP